MKPVHRFLSVRGPRTATAFPAFPAFPAALLPACGFLIVVFLIPVVQLLVLSLIDANGAFSFAHFARLLETPVYFHVLAGTFRIAGWTTLACLVIGYPVAYLLASCPLGLQSKLLIGVLMPFWTSVLVRTFAWSVILGRNGALNQGLQATGIASEPLDLMFNLTSVLIGMSHALMPMAVLTMLAVMQNIDPRLANAAATLGANAAQRFWRVVFPLSAPGVAAAGLLTFITALGFFITPTLLGSPREVMLAQLIVVQIDETLDWGFAGAIALLLLATSLLVFTVFNKVVGMAVLTGTARDAYADGWLARRGKAAGRVLTDVLAYVCGKAVDLGERVCVRVRPGRLKPGAPRRLWLWVFGGGGILFLAVPSFFLVPMSFTAGSFLEWPSRGFSWQWYETYLESPVWRAATLRSLAVGLVVATVSVAVGIPAAFALSRRSIPGKSAVMGFLLLPLILPHIIVALALFYGFSRVGLVGSDLGLVLGHVVFALPYVVITVMAVLRHYDERLDQAAFTLGAGKFATFRRVTFPLIKAGVVTAFLFAFVKSFDELTVALFISGGAATTLPRQMWSDALLNVTPTLAAVSTLILVFVTAVILAAEALTRKSARPL